MSTLTDALAMALLSARRLAELTQEEMALALETAPELVALGEAGQFGDDVARQLLCLAFEVLATNYADTRFGLVDLVPDLVITAGVRTCHVCGCAETDAAGRWCRWVRPDLCLACAERIGPDEPRVTIHEGRTTVTRTYMAGADPQPPAAAPAVCRVCGCTAADCRSCIALTGAPCRWIEPDLCSACGPAPDVRRAVWQRTEAQVIRGARACCAKRGYRGDVAAAYIAGQVEEWRRLVQTRRPRKGGVT